MLYPVFYAIDSIVHSINQPFHRYDDQIRNQTSGYCHQVYRRNPIGSPNNR